MGSLSQKREGRNVSLNNCALCTNECLDGAIITVTCLFFAVYNMQNMSVSLTDSCTKVYTGNDTYKCLGPEVCQSILLVKLSLIRLFSLLVSLSFHKNSHLLI